MLQSSRSFACCCWLLLLSLQSASAALLVVPNEVPSVLSLVYSNIPPVRKGTDSRFGFGFRLGEHADFQILVELGPQKETQPIGNQDSDNSLSKRQLSKQEQRKAFIQQQKQKWQQMTSTERTASSWLESWSKSNSNNKKPTKKHKQTEVKTDEGIVLPTMPVMPELALKQLQLLHRMATTTTTMTTSNMASSSSTTTTPKPFTGGPLNLGAPAGFTLRPVAVTQPSQLLEVINPRKTKSQITAELMDVRLDDEAA